MLRNTHELFDRPLGRKVIFASNDRNQSSNVLVNTNARKIRIDAKNSIFDVFSIFTKILDFSGFMA